MPAYNFASLSSFDFEELTCDLLQAEWKTRLESFTPGRDDGIDLRGYADTKKETIVQCKHLAGGNFQKLLSVLRRDELPKVKKLAPKRYVVVTSVGITPKNKKVLKKLFKPFIKRQSDIIGRTELNTLLRRHPRIEASNFKLWLTSTEVLQRVLFNAEKWQTEFEVDRVARKLPLFVQNDAFPRAQKILDESRIVVAAVERREARVPVTRRAAPPKGARCCQRRSGAPLPIIYATAMISPDLDDDVHTVGKFSARDDPSLLITTWSMARVPTRRYRFRNALVFVDTDVGWNARPSVKTIPRPIGR